MVCKRCGRKSSDSGEQCSACATAAPPGLRRSRRSGRNPRLFSTAEIAASEAVTAPIVFAVEPVVPVPGKGPLPLVAQFPQAAGAAGGPPLLEPSPVPLPAPEGATRQLHSSMLPPSLGVAADGAVTEMLPTYALPFEFRSPEAPLPPLPRPGPPGPPLSERLNARPRRTPPPRLSRRSSVELPPLFASQLQPRRKRPEPAPAPEASAFFSSQVTPERSSLPLVVLAVAGLVTGLGGGYWLMQGKHSAPPPAAAHGAPAPAARAGVVPAPKPDAATKVVRASRDEDEVEPASLVAAMKPRPGAPPLTVVRAEARDGEGDTRLAGLSVPASGGCPDGMRLVSGAAAVEGARAQGSFCIDQYEYPNRAGTAPAVTVSWDEAQRACAVLSKRLCAADEWERACEGPQAQRFPYGEAYDAQACNAGALAGAGHFPRCRSGFGVVDLPGNAAEWTATAAGEERIVKGGGFATAEASARCAGRKSAAPATRSPSMGFRCCASASR